MTTKILRNTRNNLLPLHLNPAHNFAANHTMHIYKSNAVYTFIPKNACSTMRLSIALNNGAIRNASEHNWIHKNNTTWKPSLKEILTANYSFIILRCPFKRLASVFLDKIVSKEINLWNLYELSNRTINMDAISFSEFVKMITKEMYINTDIHWRPQVHFLLYDVYDDYFAFERFHKIKSTLADKIDFNITDARAHLRHDTGIYTKIMEGDFSNTSAAEIAQIKRGGYCPDHSTLYTEELFDIVEKAYHPDIGLYKNKCGKENILVL